MPTRMTGPKKIAAGLMPFVLGERSLATSAVQVDFGLIDSVFNAMEDFRLNRAVVDRPGERIVIAGDFGPVGFVPERMP